MGADSQSTLQNKLEKFARKKCPRCCNGQEVKQFSFGVWKHKFKIGEYDHYDDCKASQAREFVMVMELEEVYGR